MEKYRFFDAVEDENGVYDREYNAQEFTDYFKALVTTGIMKGAGNELAVTTNGSNMITSIDTGIAFILGRYYENDSPLELIHDTETLGKSRIDRIVIRMNLSTEARYVRAFIKKGVASSSPVAPTLTQTPNLYEISLAQVKIVGGQTYISANDIIDERGTDVISPWAGSNILPNFSDSNIGQPGGIAVYDEAGRVVDAFGNEVKMESEDWISVPLLNSNTGFLLCRKFSNTVQVMGTVSSSGTNGALAQLPVGYRPKTFSNNYPAVGIDKLMAGLTYAVKLTISTNGEITSNVGLNAGGQYIINVTFLV